MRIQIEIQSPIPASVNASYGNFGFHKFGVCCWVYDGFDGEVEFINTSKFCTEPKLPKPTGFRYWFQQGVVAKITPSITVRGDIADAIIAGQLANAVTGKGMPLALP